MDEKNFDKKLKDLLRNPPSFDMDVRALKDMQARLIEANRPSRIRAGIAWWWLPLAILPLLVAGIFFFLRFQSLQQEVEGLQTQLSGIQRDSLILQKQITYQYDTVYTTIYKDVVVERKIGKSNTAGALSTYSELPNQPGIYHFFNTPSNRLFSRNLGLNDPLLPYPALNSGFLTFGTDRYPALSAPAATDEQTREQSAAQPAFTSSPALPVLRNPALVHDEFRLPAEWLLLSPRPEKLKRRLHPLAYAVPTAISAGPVFTPFILSGPEHHSDRFAYGLSVEIAFPRLLRLKAGLELLSTRFHLSDSDDYDDYPILAPNDPADLLEEIKGSFRYLQLPLEGKLVFRQQKAIRPFIQAGIVATKPLKQVFEYEYISNSQGEYTIGSTFRDGALAVNSFRSGLGVEYGFFNKFSATAGVYYQHSSKQEEGEYFRLRYWGLATGLTYQF